METRSQIETRVTTTHSLAAEAVEEFLVKNGAYWKWDGHKHVAELASGKLSNFYANLSPLFTDSAIREAACLGLYSLLRAGLVGDTIHSEELTDKNLWEVGSAMGGIWIASGLATKIGPPCRCAYTEKSEDGMVLKRFDLGETPYVILVEDVITTGGTTGDTADAIAEKHPDVTFHPDMFVVINRSGNPDLALRHRIRNTQALQRLGAENTRIRALLDVEARTWDSIRELPGYMEGCKPLKPKGNWKALATELLYAKDE